MDPLSPYPILPIILVALATMHLSAKILRIKSAAGRYSTIDGMRGYLAFFVFLHHSSMWYLLLHGFGWRHPPSYLYDHFGPTSVCVFFMITAFLFFSKLLDTRHKEMDWLKLYVSRVLRIMPLYVLTMLFLFFIVAILTHFTLREPLPHLLLGITKWLAFIQADINGLVPTWIINAGVVWTLAFEWMFYWSLPYIAILLRIRSSFYILIPALAGLIFFIFAIEQFYPSGGFTRAIPFLSGMVAAVLARNDIVKAWASHSIASIFVIFAVTGIVIFYPSIYTFFPLLLMTIIFILIASGTDVFGILTVSISRTLGQISYSIYLLHGFVLYIVFKWGWGFERVAHFSPLAYWAVIAVCAVPVVLISSCSYRFIERPFLDGAPSVTRKIRSRSAKRTSLLNARTSKTV